LKATIHALAGTRLVGVLLLPCYRRLFADEEIATMTNMAVGLKQITVSIAAQTIYYEEWMENE